MESLAGAVELGASSVPSAFSARYQSHLMVRMANPVNSSGIDCLIAKWWNLSPVVKLHTQSRKPLNRQLGEKQRLYWRELLGAGRDAVTSQLVVKSRAIDSEQACRLAAIAVRFADDLSYVRLLNGLKAEVEFHGGLTWSEA